MVCFEERKDQSVHILEKKEGGSVVKDSYRYGRNTPTLIFENLRLD